MTDTSAEALATVCQRITVTRNFPARIALMDSLAASIDALRTERDAALSRAETAEARVERLRRELQGVVANMWLKLPREQQARISAALKDTAPA